MAEDAGGLVHTALFYRGESEYLDAVVPFVRDGVDRGERVFVAVPADKLTLVRGAVGHAAAGIAFTDMAKVGRNPARGFPMMSAVGDQGAGRVRIVAEPVWPGRCAETYPACVQNEALFNTTFASWPLTTLCPYDAAGLDDGVLADARATHPLIQQNSIVSDSGDFASWETLARYNIPLPPDPSAVTFTVRTFEDLSAARAFVARCSASAGLSVEAIADLQLIATELATNSLEYTGGACTLALWQRDGAFVCQADDAGRLDDPLAGRRAPACHTTGGRGLFLVNALADLVRTHTSEAGTAIRAYLSLGCEQEALT